MCDTVLMCVSIYIYIYYNVDIVKYIARDMYIPRSLKVCQYSITIYIYIYKYSYIYIYI